MKVKRYVADSIQEAITRVKNDLGRNAIILHTKPFKEGGIFGFFAKRRFEVIAAVDENIQESTPAKKGDEKTEPVIPAGLPQNPGLNVSQNGRTTVPEPVPVQIPVSNPVPVLQTVPSVSSNISTGFNPVPLGNTIQFNNPIPQGNTVPHTNPLPYDNKVLPAPEIVSSPTTKTANVRENTPVTEPGLKSLHEEIAEVKELIRQVASKPLSTTTMMDSPMEKASTGEQFRNFLESIGMEGDIIDYLLTQIPSYLKEADTSEDELIEYCRQVLTTRLMFSEPVQTTTNGEQQIMALIGPTGVGKTTTIAKLAANFNLFEGKKVGLITIDTYRIAAVEHLKTYGDIINLPVEVVYTPSDINQAIQNLKDCNLILIDTAGRSPHNQVMMDELKKFLSHSKIGLILLVVSATTKYQDMVSIATNFSRIAYTHLVFTKLDETESLGPIVSMAWKIRRPISYLTTGQNVPDDIEVAKPEKLISQLLKRDNQK
jgi:flagellar biosynthesis protein FlhF